MTFVAAIAMKLRKETQVFLLVALDFGAPRAPSVLTGETKDNLVAVETKIASILAVSRAYVPHLFIANIRWLSIGFARNGLVAHANTFSREITKKLNQLMEINCIYTSL